jgi:hypothetical protein
MAGGHRHELRCWRCASAGACPPHWSAPTQEQRRLASAATDSTRTRQLDRATIVWHFDIPCLVGTHQLGLTSLQQPQVDPIGARPLGRTDDSLYFSAAYPVSSHDATGKGQRLASREQPQIPSEHASSGRERLPQQSQIPLIGTRHSGGNDSLHASAATDSIASERASSRGPTTRLAHEVSNVRSHRNAAV